MTVQAQRQRAARERLAKKPKNAAASNGSSLLITTVDIVFNRKSILISHNELRSQTLRHHPGKLSKPLVSWQSSSDHQQHGVELTDDVVIRDPAGRRVPVPAYATLRIDQFPQFRKS